MDPITVGTAGIIAAGAVAAAAGTSSAKVAAQAPKVHKDEVADFSDVDGTKFTIETGREKHTIRVAKTGIAGAKPITMMKALRQAVQNHGDKVCLRVEENLPPYKAGEKPPKSLPLEQWRSWTYQELYNDSLHVGRGLMHLGMERASGIAVWGANGIPWYLTMMGAAFGAGIAAGLYTTDTPDQVKYKLKYSNVTICVVESVAHAEKILLNADELPSLKAIAVWAPDRALPSHNTVKTVTFSQLAELGKKVSEQELLKREEEISPGSVFMYTFTSGTTGQPKAAMITHDNVIYTVRSMCHSLKNDGGTGLFCGGEHRLISYLPLSHVAGSLMDIIYPIVQAGTSPNTWASVAFARPYDLKAGTIVERFKVIKPTIFFGVPRVFEKIMEKMQATVAVNPPTGAKLRLAKWALKLSMQHQMNCQLGGSGAKGWGYGIAKKAVLDKIRDALGFTETKFLISAAAPLSKDVQQFFAQRGLHINEGYGMTESCGGSTFTSNEAHVWGSIGFANGALEVCVRDSNGNEAPFASNLESPEDEAQGEICIRGRSVFAGYLVNASLGAEHVKTLRQKTAEAVDAEGWLHTGDMGVKDVNGFFKITGRYKELIIGAGGENIAPVPIENEIKKQCDAIANVMMLGDKRKFNVALITLKVKGATGELPGTNELDVLAKACVSAGTTTVEAACKDEKLIAAITKAIKDTNANGAVVPSNAAKVQKFTILPTDFSVEGGELTASLKLKRHTVTKKYEEHIDAVYASKATYVPFPLSRL